MKVIHIILGKSNPDRMNGVNRVVNQLATVQHINGLDVEVWGITGSPEGEKPEVEYSLKLFKTHKNPFKLDELLKLSIKQYVLNAVFHIHGGFVPVFYSVGKFIKRQGGKYIVSPHGTYANAAIRKSNKYVKRAYIKLFESSLLNGASAVHLLGKSSDEGIRNLLIRKEIIPNGFYVHKIELPTSVKHEVPVFGFLGRLSQEHKGLDLMINGFCHYSKEVNGKARLWLIGDGESKNGLKKMVEKLGVNDQVVFWGGKFGEEKNDLLKKIDFFMHTSRHEGLPTAMVEAAAFGKPLIGSEGTNFTGYIKNHEAGIALEKNTPDCIAEAMLYCHDKYKTEEYDRWSANARKMAVADFDWQTIHHSFLKLYQSV